MPTLKVKVSNIWYTVEVPDRITTPLWVLVDGEPVEVDLDDVQELIANMSTPMPDVEATQNSDQSQPTGTPVHPIHAPLPGVIVSLEVRVGDSVQIGDDVCVLEAMKMHQMLRSEWNGVVSSILVQPGINVAGGQTILEISPE